MNEQAKQLIETLYRGQGYGHYWKPGKTKKDTGITTWFDSKHIPELPTLDQIYYGVFPGKANNDEYHRTTNDSVLMISALIGDFDSKDFADSKENTLNHIKQLEPQPGILVSSGNGYHAYWLLDEPVYLDDDNREETRQLLIRWGEYIGSDKAGVKLTQLLRLPGTYNTKNGERKLVETVWFDPTIRFTLHELESLLEPQKPKSKPIAGPSRTYPNGNWKESLTHWTDKALDRARPGNRDHTGYWLAEQLRDAGLTPEQAMSSDYPEKVPQTKDRYTRKDWERNVKSAYSREPREPARNLNAPAPETIWRADPPPPDNDFFWDEISNMEIQQAQNSEVIGMKVQQAVEIPKPEKQTELVEYAPGKKATTDLGNAERMTILHGADIHWSNELKNWQVWNGTRWIEDTSGEVKRRAQAVAKSILIEAYNEPEKSESKKLIQWAYSSQSKPKLDAMIDLTKSQTGITVSLAEFDTDPYKLNFLNGTLDLQTGQLYEHTPLDFISKQIQLDYDPRAKCPQWLKFLDDVMDHDQNLINYIQRCVGYSLTGDTSEQCLFVLHGAGSNGKSVFIETILKVLGEDYTKTARAETILAKEHNRAGATPDIARLRGARLVSINEIPLGSRLNESIVKEMTGNDSITARFLFSEEFTFTPNFKLWIRTNNKPVIKEAGEAIWRRMRLIPFTVVIPEINKDAKLILKLQKEWQGIIAWAVQGCLEWQKNGLQTPEKVQSATKEYRADEDILKPFFEDKCILNPDVKTIAGDLYKAYIQWCEENKERAANNTRFGRLLSERGFEKKRITAGNVWLGIGVKE